ncbi:tRNA (adenosine(37)-N6)-threonylcarbamoyltransferase complex transferase subunit TsaD [Candidatus Woesebacteria bacterium]|nr:tRNA (adenosine(37)-N6)-threonylcarbamoyltransferase complex transferase subunit TsaD [Candidatus Woesebacteria bacterium]
MIILGIETSCDETAASVVKDGKKILSHVIASSSDMHIKTGGIIPESAAREQVKSIIPVIQEALSEAKTKPESLDAIAVTSGPGLIGSLLVGVETAKTLSYVWNKPIVPVNHLVAHLYANWLDNKPPKFPAVALVVSGGHTDLVLMKNHDKIEYIGGTRDDAAGEAFDKTARLLGLPYPGGPSIAEAAMKLKVKSGKSKVSLPRPMINEDNFDFSFSGLKTAVLRETEKKIPVNEFAHEIQEAITDVLVKKTLRAVKKYKTPTLLLAGGVAANQRLTEKFQMEIGKWNMDIRFHVPPPRLCTDNASYIATFAEYNFKPIKWGKITANPSLTITGV